MATVKKRINFYESIEGVRVKQLLTTMVSDDTFNTAPSYSADIEVYPNNLIPFIDKHMRYLSSHPSVNAGYYVSNLRLMTRIK
jgi:hypothetical protein